MWRNFPSSAARTLAVTGCLLMAVARVASGQPGEALTPWVDSTRVMVLGSGGRPISGPLGVAIDPRAREVALANTGAGRVEFFDYRGRPRGAFMHTVLDGDGNTMNGLPQQVAVDAQGRVLVTDAYSADLWVRDFRGGLITRVTLPAPDDDRRTGGAGPIAIAPDGRIYVASRAQQGRVHVLGADFRHLETWGQAGSEPGRLGAITGITALGDSEVVVTCLFTELGIQVFDRHGAYRHGFGIHDIGPGNVSQPVGVITDAGGRLWVLDAVRRTLQSYDRAGSPLCATGSGDGPGTWLYPSALASDGRGLFAMAESGGNRLRLLWIRLDGASREAIAPAPSETGPAVTGFSSVTNQ